MGQVGNVKGIRGKGKKKEKIIKIKQDTKTKENKK